LRRSPSTASTASAAIGSPAQPNFLPESRLDHLDHVGGLIAAAYVAANMTGLSATASMRISSVAGVPIAVA
jgi:hypothetical protein